MPILQTSARKKQTAELRRRIHNLTRYDPDHYTSEDETEGRTSKVKGPVSVLDKKGKYFCPIRKSLGGI